MVKIQPRKYGGFPMNLYMKVSPKQNTHWTKKNLVVSYETILPKVLKLNKIELGWMREVSKDQNNN